MDSCSPLHEAPGNVPASRWHGVIQRLTGAARHQIHEKRPWLYPTALIALLILYCTLFWHLPMSEDAGFYAYLSRAIAHGMTLHRDIWFSSNSIGIYATALLFKIAGASFNLYRLVHAIGLFFVVLMVYFIASRGKRYERGFLAAFLAGVFCTLPHIILDLGRNYIVWATGFVLAGFFVQSSNAKNKEIYSGILLGAAALMRETFVLAGIGLLAYEIGRLALGKWQGRSASYRPLIAFSVAFLLTIALSAVILTCYGTWEGYYRDMVQSGTSFRYKSGILDPHRIADNLSQLGFGFRHYYYPILALALLSYFIGIKDNFLSYVKYVLVPAFTVEAVVVNRTVGYSIIPILVFACILTSYFLFELKEMLARHISLRTITLKAVLLTSALLLLSVGTVNCALNTSSQFRDYYKLAEEMSSTKLSDSTERTARLLYAADLLPHDTVSALSEYPFLFQSKKFYGTDPFVQDLSASANLNRPDIWDAQLNYLETTPTDLLILKTPQGYLSKWTDLGRVINENYITVCDFPFAEIADSSFYKNRVLLSRNAFTASYTLWKEDTVETPFEGYNDRNEGIIVCVGTSVPEDIRSYSVSANSSRIQCAEEYTDDLVIFSLVPPESEFKIEPLAGTTPANKELQVRYYVRNQQE